MIKIGITGQSGFIGTHLYNNVKLNKKECRLIEFEDSFFNDENNLTDFVNKCDCIIHLAALNRHPEPSEIYNTNMGLVKKLVKALDNCNSKAHIMFSSSIQEEKENVYGDSKKEGRKCLAEWAVKNGSGFTGLVIPNVFGPFGKPFYNSVISTFSYQLVNNELPQIETDTEINLIYIDELVRIIQSKIQNNMNAIEEYYLVPSSYKINVSGILEKLKIYKKQYFEEGIIPSFKTEFDRNLFNTFRSYINPGNYFPVNYKINSDSRGFFVELVKLHQGGQISYSITKPGITRGNHFHTRKIERFIVLKGNAVIQLRKIGTNEIIDFKISGNNPSYIDMPVWYTHNIKNIGDEDLYTVFWINEIYDPSNPDTFEEVV